jgi:hypothetical protein
MSTDRQGAPAPAGTVAVLFSSEAGRHSSLFKNLNDLKVPDGTVKTFWYGERDAALNSSVEDALASHSYWIWFISEDHAFEPDLLEKLLSREQPIVAPVVVENTAPYSAMAWTDIGSKGPVSLPLNDVIGPASMVEVRGATVTGMLVRRAVFEAMGSPWFRRTQSLTENVSEDQYFCERARGLSFQTYLDTSSRLATLSDAAVMPTHKGDRWELSVGVGDNMKFTQPLRHSG